MKIVIDQALKMLRGVFEPFAGVAYLPGAAISAGDVRDADALIVRTRTRCDLGLLGRSNVKIVATATIGFDHIDTGYCRDNGIEVSTSAGSNARGVAQYVFAAIDALGMSPAGKTLGIIGVGNIGNIVSAIASSSGFRVLENDPPRRAREGCGRFTDIDRLLAAADIITLHVPLDTSTRDMVSDDFLRKMKPGAALINSSRGEVMDEKTIAAARRSGRLGRLVMDVWCNEPDIDPALLAAADIATPHIAGYSLQGRANAGAMAVRAVARKLDIRQLQGWYPEGIEPSIARPDITWSELTASMPSYYDIMADDRALRSDPSAFESLRNNYDFRKEFF